MAPRLNINADYPTANPGEFRHRITLLGPVIGSDAAGANVTYQAADPPVTAWAKIEYLRGSELIKSGVDVTQNFIKITSWFRSEFLPNMRISTPSGKLYIIQAVENVKEMGVYMIIYGLGLGAND